MDCKEEECARVDELGAVNKGLKKKLSSIGLIVIVW